MNKNDKFFDNLEIFILDIAFNKEICNYEYCNNLFNELIIILKKIDCNNFIRRLNDDYDLNNISYEVSKYYVKIANLIGSIFNTINPIKEECKLFIKEFEYLYNDVYNSSTNEYNDISETNINNYKNDLEIFNKYFSKKQKDIKRFSDINMINCNLEINNYTTSLRYDSSSIVMMKYANSIINMFININKHKVKLNTIFNKLILVKENNIILNNNIQVKDLDIYINNTRKILIELYKNYNKDKKDMENVLKLYIDIYNYKNIGCVK